MNDEELQNQIEKSGSDRKDVDAHAYRMLFNALNNHKSDFSLSDNFAEHVINKINEKKEARRDVLAIILGVTGFLIVAGIVVMMAGFTIDFGALKFFANYSGLFVFGTVFITILHFIDKKVLKTSVNS